MTVNCLSLGEHYISKILWLTALRRDSSIWESWCLTQPRPGMLMVVDELNHNLLLLFVMSLTWDGYWSLAPSSGQSVLILQNKWCVQNDQESWCFWKPAIFFGFCQISGHWHVTAKISWTCQQRLFRFCLPGELSGDLNGFDDFGLSHLPLRWPLPSWWIWAWNASCLDVWHRRWDANRRSGDLLMACSHGIFQCGYGGTQGNFKTASLGRHPGGHSDKPWWELMGWTILEELVNHSWTIIIDHKPLDLGESLLWSSIM